MTEGQWAPDPSGRHQYRWYDGSAWTDRVADHGNESVDPLSPAPPGPPPVDPLSAAPPSPPPVDPLSAAPPSPPPVDPLSPAPPGPPGPSPAPPGPPPSRPPAPPAVGYSTSAGRSVVVPDGTVISSRGRRFVGFVLTIVLIIATLIIGYAIWTMVLWSRGQTPAKQLMGMRVMVAESGQTARWGQMALRGFVIDTLIPFVPFLGWIFSVVSAGWIFGNDEHRRLTDYMAGTIVVDDPQNRYG